MRSDYFSALRTSQSHGETVEECEAGIWRLTLPPGPAGVYRWAQLDDYHQRSREQFPILPPVLIRVEMRVSAPDIPGTWGIGLWNDPFSINIGLGEAQRRLPALPDAAWFFHASPPNWLTLRDGQPGDGFLAGVFSSRRIPRVFLAPAVVCLPLMAFGATADWIRRAVQMVVNEKARRMDVDETAWNTYEIEWLDEAVNFRVNGISQFQTDLTPAAPLGLVIWIDNQFLEWRNGKKARFGTLATTETAWLEVRQLEVTRESEF